MNICNFSLFLAVLLFCGETLAGEYSLHQTEQHCFGVGREQHFLSLQCNDTQYIELEEVKEVQATNSCILEDCSTDVIFDNALKKGPFESRCNGRVTCNISASDAHGLKKDDCGYVQLIIVYKCKEDLETMCSQNETGQPLVYSPNYPAKMNRSSLNCSCNITASSGVDIYVIAIELHNSTSLTATDASQDEIALKNISNRRIYPPITLNLVKHSSESTNGIFLIKFTGENPITINCLDNEPEIPGSSTMTTVPIQSSSFVPVKNRKIDSSILAGVIVCILAILVLIIIIISVWIYRHKSKRGMESKKKADTNFHDIHLNHSDVNANNIANGTSVSFAHADDGQENYSAVSKIASGKENKLSTHENKGFNRDNTDDYSAPAVPNKSRESRQFFDVGEQNNLQGEYQEEPKPHYAESLLYPPTEEQRIIRLKSTSGYDEALPADFESVSVNNQMPNSYDEALPANYKSTSTGNVDPKTPKKNQNSGPKSVQDFILVPKNPDYAQAYMKTSGDKIKDKPILEKPSPYSYAAFQNIPNLGKPGHYSYADNRGRFIKGVTPHIIGDGYVVEQRPAEPVGKTAVTKNSLQLPQPSNYEYTEGQTVAIPLAIASINSNNPKPNTSGEYQDIASPDDDTSDNVFSSIQTKGESTAAMNASNPKPQNSGEYQDIASPGDDKSENVLSSLEPKPAARNASNPKPHTSGEYQDIASPDDDTSENVLSSSQPKRESTASYQEIGFVSTLPKPTPKKYAKDGAELFDNEVYSGV